MYEIIFDEEAIKYLEKLPKDISKRIFNKICQTNTALPLNRGKSVGWHPITAFVGISNKGFVI